MTRYLADTALFVYADGGAHHYREPCRAVVERVARGLLALEASVEVLQEYAHVQLRSGRPREHVVGRAREIAGLCRIHAVEPQDGALMLDLLGRDDRLAARDALFAATALNRGIEAILTTDRDFDRVPGLDRADPAEVVEGRGADTDLR